MRRLILIVAIVATATGMTPALASAASTHKCKTSGHQILLKIQGSKCNVAKALANYSGSHETLDGSFYAVHRSWLGTVLNRKHNHTALQYISPGSPYVVVWITLDVPVG